MKKALCLIVIAGLVAAESFAFAGVVRAASNVAVVGTTLVFTAAKGKANLVSVTADEFAITISDKGDTIVPGDGCVASDPGTVRCNQADITLLSISLRDNADELENHTGLDSVVDGGFGNDILRGGAGDDDLNGGAGVDQLRGGTGDDILRGGSEDDFLNGGPGADVMGGGPGTDLAYYGSRTVRVAASIDDIANDGEAGEGDNILSTVEDITGGSRADTLSGSAAANELSGLAGNDTVFGKAGNDTLRGGLGFDALNGGAGTDECVVGPGGGTALGCE